MLKSQIKPEKVSVVLRHHMVVDKERRAKGEIIDLSYRDYVYLANHDRVAEATKENIEAVKAEIKAEAELAERQAQPSEADKLKARIANLEVEMASAKKSK